MGIVASIWNKITSTKALEQSSGKFETIFFESVYRVTYIGGWSVHDHDIGYRIYSGIIKLTTALLIMSEIWYLFSESNNLDSIIDNVNATLIHLIALYRYRNMIKNKAIYKNLSTSMESEYFDPSTKRRERMVHFWSQRNERFLILLLSLGFGALSAWHVYPLVDDVEYNLMVAVRFPFSYETPFRYCITYIVTFFVFNFTSLFVMINDLIMQAHLLHLLCQYTVLADCFRYIVEDCVNGDVKENFIANDLFMTKYLERLHGLVEQHKFILRNTMDLKRSLNAPMLGQFAASSMLICGISFQATTTVGISLIKFFMSLLYLMYNMFELFIFCKWCDEIKIQSQNIGEAAYSSGWEQGISLRPGVRSRLLLVIARAQKPLVLSAGGLFELSLESYTTLVKTSYSALTVLRRFQTE
ncbi:odorant receptor 4-like [Aricia agestis]|uniref:odorant receptor 4-like n=1 Tax=Aricia agestis TaxID=91739 RepID=UPI001C20BBFB|nr:odorant receptor 4-like [Aricia agestis]